MPALPSTLLQPRGPAPACDGCGLPQPAEHVARRMKRLELATRFRPIHINVLFLTEAPPPRPEDYFYAAATEAPVRQGLSAVLFNELMRGVGIDTAGKSEDQALGEFQRGGFFLADCLECPVEDIVPGVREGARANAFELAHRYGPAIVLRVERSYKPKHIVPISTRTRHVAPILQKAGLGDRLCLHDGLPLHFPHPHNPAAQAQFRAGLAGILKRIQ